MRTMRILVCGIVAAAALLAVAGAGTASAIDVWCRSRPANFVCPPGDRLPGGTVMEASLQEKSVSEFASALVTVDCSGSALKLEATSESGEPLPATVNSLVWTNCKSSGGPCSVKATELPWEAAVLWAPNSWDAIASVPGFGIEFTCGSFTCKYAAEIEVEFKGGEPAEIRVNGVEAIKTGGVFCSKTGKWTARYTVSSPDPEYVETL